MIVVLRARTRPQRQRKLGAGQSKIGCLLTRLIEPSWCHAGTPLEGLLNRKELVEFGIYFGRPQGLILGYSFYEFLC